MLFGHGKTAFIAMLSPIPVILLFGLFFAPILMDRGETFYSIATFNDDDDRIGQLMTLILNYENTTGNITIYPVKEKETCKKLVDEGKVAIFIYVPQICYTKFGASFNADGSKVIVKPADMIFSKEITLDLGDIKVKALPTEAPHTDDSTLVYVENDKTLFLGDATCNDYMTGIKSADLTMKLADTIKSINPEICLEGHWTPEPTKDTLKDLLSGINLGEN